MLTLMAKRPEPRDGIVITGRDYWSSPHFASSRRTNTTRLALRLLAPAKRSGPETEFGQRVSRSRLVQDCAKALHGGASEPRLGHDKIIMLVLRRDEAKAVLPGNRLDCDPSIGSTLRNGDTHRVVRFRL